VIGIRNHIDGWYRADRWMLAHQEWLGRYAAIQVFEVFKPA
jgi:hypothetical protein